jgi:hypothetical protein
LGIVKKLHLLGSALDLATKPDTDELGHVLWPWFPHPCCRMTSWKHHEDELKHYMKYARAQGMLTSPSKRKVATGLSRNCSQELWPPLTAERAEAVICMHHETLPQPHCSLPTSTQPALSKSAKQSHCPVLTPSHFLCVTHLSPLNPSTQ